ncbi:hypothetical protein, partial [Salmonella enterica]|uniref:hypothetical protein n=1 Tax=Salmonella enterica TaxID=28901 RepID=UPI001C4E1C01
MPEDGLRTFRFPADKRGFDRVNGRPWSKTGKQVNFETKNGDGDVIANVHLTWRIFGHENII